jgi:hypothetical protein
MEKDMDITQINSLFIPIGAIIAALIALFGTIWSTNKKLTEKSSYLQKDEMCFVGAYEVFHSSTAREKKIIISEIYIEKIKNAINYKVKLKSFGYSYTGTMEVLEGNLYVLLKGVMHSEVMQIVLKAPLNNKFDIISGVFSCIDELKNPVAGLLIFRKVSSDPYCRKLEICDVDTRIKNLILVEGNPLKSKPLSNPIFDELET